MESHYLGGSTGTTAGPPAPPPPSQSFSTPWPRARSPCVGVTNPSRQPLEPSLSRWHRTLTVSPGLTSSRLMPTRCSPPGPVASRTHVAGCPLSSLTSTYSQECGTSKWISLTVPSIVVHFETS